MKYALAPALLLLASAAPASAQSKLRVFVHVPVHERSRARRLPRRDAEEGERRRAVAVVALLAGRREVAALVTRQGIALVVVGLIFGWAAAVLLTRALTPVLYGVESTDLVRFLGTAALLGIVALAANWLPARRAARIHPVTALRYE